MLIILYGDISNKSNWKQQRMIDGGATCGYREFARKFGKIIYMCPQNIKQPWEHSIAKPKNILNFIKRYPKAIVWSVKYSAKKDNLILSNIKNKKIYYSCNSKRMYNDKADVSLVDTPGRVRKNGKLWHKGKDPDYWKPLPEDQKEYDYIMIGQRGDKNEIYFIKRLNDIKEKRKIIWVGGHKHSGKIPKTHHDITLTKFVPQDQVRDLIPKAKVGILFTELKIEGFPQSFLEMTMCGVPVVYSRRGPKNEFYFHKDNSVICVKKNLISAAENLLINRNQKKCRSAAINNYSIDKAYERILSCIK